MNRRLFLSALLGTASAMALDPERLLWTPGAKLISIPTAKAFVEPEIILAKTRLVAPRIFIDIPTVQFWREGVPAGFKVREHCSGYVTVVRDLMAHERTDIG